MPKLDPLALTIERTLRDWRIYPVLGVVLLVAPVVLGFLAWPLLKWVLSSQFTFSLFMMALVLFIVIHLCAGLILAERKLSAYIQDRMGPNRVGWLGLLQPIADGIKFILKEDILPRNVDKPIFILAPCIAFTVALSLIAVIPWAGTITWPWTDANGAPIVVTSQVANLNIGVLYMLALGAMSVYGVVLAGWASNSKYAFYGGMRATAQMLSYEIPLGLGILTVLLISGTLQLEPIIHQQAASGIWNVFLHPVAFFLVLVAAFAETNRAPFDLAECEQELVAGYHTEYSAMKFALFFLAEYSHMVIGSALIVALFLGGWEPLPFFPLLADNTTWWAAIIKFHVFWGKILVILGLYMVIRWTLPRFRFDQLMRLAWQSMIPVGMILVTLTGVLAVFGLQRNIFASIGVNVLLIGLLLWISGRTRRRVTGRQEDLPEIEVAPANAGIGRGLPQAGAGMLPAT